MDEIPLQIEYRSSGDIQADIEKRYELQRRLDSLLKKNKLGRCDGGSCGDEIMDVLCYVPDFNKAKAVIQYDINDSEFGDYSDIYNELEDNRTQKRLLEALSVSR